MSDGFDLRWWLLSLFNEKLDYEPLYDWSVALATVVFLVAAVFGPSSLATPGNFFERMFKSDFTFCLFACLLILAGRWPGLVADELNPDESYFIAGAQKLLHDPVYWRAADLGTSGPLNAYPLIVPAMFGVKLELAIGRCFGLILVGTCCVSLFFSLKLLFDGGTARLAVAPVISTFAAMRDVEFIHLSSEHVPIALLSLGLLLLCQIITNLDSLKAKMTFALGCVLGMAPYAKLQSGPIGASIVLIVLHVIWTSDLSPFNKRRKTLWLFAGLLSFSLIHLLLVLATGQLENFFRAYIAQNLFFSNFGGSYFHKARIFRDLCGSSLDLSPILALTLTMMFIVTPLLAIVWYTKSTTLDRLNNSRVRNAFVLLTYALLFLSAASYAIAQPEREFRHYCLFLLLPCGFVIGTALGIWQRLTHSLRPLTRSLSGMQVALTSVLLVFAMWPIGNAILGSNRFIRKIPRFKDKYISNIARSILEKAQPGDSMAIWGWTPILHLETGVVQASCDSVPIWQFRSSPQHAFFVTRYAREIELMKPRFIVDTQIPNTIGYHWLGTPNFRMDEVPEIEEVVRRNYSRYRTVDGATIYLRH